MTGSTEQYQPQVSHPLSGKKILITRSRERASRFAALVREYGAEPLEVPTIQSVPPSSWEPLDHALAAIRAYDWLIFTSVTGVQAFFARFDAHGGQLTELQGPKVCAIGPATANALQERGIEVDVMPHAYRAEAIVERLSALPIAGKRLLIPRAAVARDLLPQALAACGACVDVVEAYRTVLPSDSLAPDTRELIAQGAIDVVTFTSSSTVANFVTLMGEADLPQLLRSAVIACIGPITADTARSYGLTPMIVSDEYTIPGLTRAIVRYYEDIQKTMLSHEE
jgi:uroporphyrinogen III methyltransferase / synthase